MTIPELHSLYVSLTGQAIRLDMAREHEWYHWTLRGFTPDDLRLMVAHLKREIAAGKRNHGALKFRNLIVNLDWFEEDLAEAKALARRPKVDPARADALRATGRSPADPPPAAKSTAEIMAASKAFEQFRNLKNQL